MKRWVAFVLIAIALASCAPAEPDALPTLAVLPSETATNQPPTSTSTATSTVEPTETTVPTDTNTPVPSATDTPTYTPTVTTTATNTSTPTATPTTRPATANPTAFAVESATAIVIERPIFSTFTPAPAGQIARPTSTGTPQVIADVLISESQFDEEITRLLKNTPAVSDVQIDFTPSGIKVTVTALSGEAFTTGTFVVHFDMGTEGVNNFVTVYADSSDQFVMNGGGLPSEAFVAVAYETVLPAVFEAFNFILNQRLGEGKHDLDNVTIDDLQMSVILLAHP